MSSTKKAFDTFGLIQLEDALDAIAGMQNTQDPAKKEELLGKVTQLLSRAFIHLASQVQKPHQSASPTLQHTMLSVDAPRPEGQAGARATSFASLFTELGKFFQNAQGNKVKLVELARSIDFVKELKTLVSAMNNYISADLGDPNKGGPEAARSKVLYDSLTSLVDMTKHVGPLAPKLANEGEILDETMQAPEVTEEPIAEKPANGAEGMLSSIESLVKDLETFLDNVPVTAFHDRDADKVARARTKASELRDDILLIRKQVMDTKAAINGETPQAERFASMARVVAMKFKSQG